MSNQASEKLDSAWYKDAVIYEVHVRSFFDSNQDGQGDFPGLTSKLDYLQDLGINTLWLLPFYPSPLRDDGYDIEDYRSIHKNYGTLTEFRAFLREAHGRGIRVITELVLNHTSDQHPWFRRARLAKPGSSERGYYVWSDSPKKYAGTRILFKDFETANWTWDPVAGAYFWHRFYAHQPDLNFDNPHVAAEFMRVVDFWLRMGVDGLRLDAVPYLYEREGTNCENLPETFALLKRLRAHVDAKYPGRMLLAEANQWPEDAARYFGAGDVCHMTFHFPLMTRLFVALEMEDRTPIVDILEQTPEIPENCQWAIFLRNHDELTLEMVSEEERDFMYQVYARDRRARINLGIRRRLAPLLHNDRRKIELMNVLLMTMPGSPVIYYGDEIGMGDNYYLGDRNGVRTPMQWSPDRNAGFSRVNPQQLYLPVVIDPEYHYQSVNVENQQRNPSSLLWWMKQLIAMRKRRRELGRGSMRFVRQDSSKVLAYLREHGQDCLLVVANLSRHAQVVRLDLLAHAGSVSVEVFGRTRFPAITREPYVLTLVPYGTYILELCGAQGSEAPHPVLRMPCHVGNGNWRFLDAGQKALLQGTILPQYLRQRSGRAASGRAITSVKLLDALPVGTASTPSWLCALEVKLTGGGDENRTLLLSIADPDQARGIFLEHPERYICPLGGPGARVKTLAAAREAPPPEGALIEGDGERQAHAGLLKLFTQSLHVRGRNGEFSVFRSKGGKALRWSAASKLDSELLAGVSDNLLIVYGRQVLLKIFRRTAEGGNPDLEVMRYLTDVAAFPHTPEFLGALQYARPGHEPVVVAMLRQYVSSESTAWDLCATALSIYFQQVLTTQEAPPSRTSLAVLVSGAEDVSADAAAPDEASLAFMEMIGRRTAEMHAALARKTEDPAFAPEPFDKSYRRAVFQDVFGKNRRILDRLEQALPGLTPAVSRQAAQILELREQIAGTLQIFRDTSVEGLKTRVHGEYDLRHLLFTGHDFNIVDFEGRTTRSLSARRLKRSPLRDVSDLLNSLSRVSETALSTHTLLRPEDGERLRPWVEHWRMLMGGRFLRSYLAASKGAAFLPQGQANLRLVLTTFLLDQTIFELGQVLEDWSDMAETEQERSGLTGLLRNIGWLLENPVHPEEEIQA